VYTHTKFCTTKFQGYLDNLAK